MSDIKSVIFFLLGTGFSLLLCTGLFIDGYGQSQQEKPILNFHQIQEGLRSNTITAINQDKDGYIWIGTNAGLHRYEGTTFHTYMESKKDSTSLLDDFILQIYKTHNGDLWIRTRKGISRYRRPTDSFSNFELPADTDIGFKPTNITEGKKDKLWLIGEGGLFYFDHETQKFYLKRKFETNNLTSIEAGYEHELWIATDNQGLIKFNTATNRIEQTYSHDPGDPHSIASNKINVLEKDLDGNLWIGTDDAGLDRMNMRDGEVVFSHYRYEPENPYSLGNDDIFNLYTDPTGKLWAGNENGGLHLYNPQMDAFYRYQHDHTNPQTLSSNSITAMFKDRAGRLWVGTGIKGLNIADPFANKFEHYTSSVARDHWLTNDVIRDFFETENGNIWIATDGGGLNYFDRKNQTFRAYRHHSNDPSSLTSDFLLDIDQDEKGNIWVGTWRGGINILTDKEQGKFISFKEMTGKDQYPIENVYDILFDSTNQYIWIGASQEGLYRYDTENQNLQLFETASGNPTSISSNLIQHLFEDSKGNLWISTLSGLNLLTSENKRQGIFKRFMYNENDTTGIPHEEIIQVYEDSKNSIWIVTRDGLAKYMEEKGRFEIYNESDGLPTNEIRSVIEDRNGHLWIGSLKGISRFDPDTKTFRNYDKSDGLQGNEFSRHTVHRLTSGELLFGGMAGFNLFDPNKIQDVPYKPPVYLSNFKLYNKSVHFNDPDSPLNQHISVTDTLILAHTDRVFTFEFVALNYTNPEQNEYAYKLEGFEANWNYVGNQQNATYTNLDPGEYTFRVKASNNDGIWNNKGVSLSLIINPPFWQTAWFYMFTALFVIGTVFAVYRARVRSIREHNKQLERQVADRTSELQDKNRDLKATLHELELTRSKLVEKARKAGMADVATGVIHNVGNILNSINVSVSIIDETLKDSRLENFKRANKMLADHLDDLEHFILSNPKGKKLLQYYLKVEKPLEKEHEGIKIQKERLQEKVNLIIEAIAAQQNFAKADVVKEKVDLRQICEDALILQSGSIERHDLVVKKDYKHIDQVEIEKMKVMHVLFNLIKNAKESLIESEVDERIIAIACWQDADYVYLSISDNGTGISMADQNKIFNYGYTTKDKGHGYGLHSCANYMKEMNGQISVDSKGPGEGAAFTIAFVRKSSLSNSSKQDNINYKLRFPEEVKSTHGD